MNVLGVKDVVRSSVILTIAITNKVSDDKTKDGAKKSPDVRGMITPSS